MPKLIYQNFMGLAPAGSSRSNLKLGQDYHIASASDLDLISNPGVLKVGKSAGTDLDSNNNISNIIRNFYHSYNGTGTSVTAYSVEKGAKIHKTNSTGTGTTDDFTNYPVSIVAEGATHNGGTPHTTFVGEDILTYRVGSTTYVFVSYNDNTDGDVARITLDGGTKDFDFMSGTASGGATLGLFPHVMREGPNGFLYISDGPSIHKFDGQTGANGTFTASVIDLPAGWVIYDMIDHKGFLWILAIQEFTYLANISSYPPRKAGIFVWNYVSNRSGSFSGFESGTPFMLDNTMRLGSIFIHNGQVHTLTLSGSNRTQLRRYDGKVFNLVWDEPGDILPNRGGVTSYLGQLTWAANGGGIYTFGSAGQGYPEVFNYIGSTGSTQGAVTIDSFGKLWVSFYNGSTYELNVLDAIPGSSTAMMLIKDLPKFSRITGIWVFWEPASDSTASTLTFNFYKNFSGTPINGSYVLTNSTHMAKGWEYFSVGGGHWENVHALRMYLTWSKVGNSTSTINPYRIEIDYELTTRLK